MFNPVVKIIIDKFYMFCLGNRVNNYIKIFLRKGFNKIFISFISMDKLHSIGLYPMLSVLSSCRSRYFISLTNATPCNTAPYFSCCTKYQYFFLMIGHANTFKKNQTSFSFSSMTLYFL